MLVPCRYIILFMRLHGFDNSNMQENSSPEEKLLELIKRGANPDKIGTKDTSPQPPKQEKSVEEPAPRPKSIPAVSRKAKTRYTKSFSVLNKFLVVLVVCVIVYMVLAYVKNPYKSKTEISSEVEVETGGELLEDTPASPPISHYVEILGGRQMFKLYEVPKPKPVGPPKPRVTLQQLLAAYTFIGVIFGDVPQAIIEEKRTGQSFYLTAGQYLGEIKIERIERGRITVSYEDEMMDVSI